jgi:hypothetical protein
LRPHSEFFIAVGIVAPAQQQKELRMNIDHQELAVVITSPNESLDRTVKLDDADALRKLKKRVTNILNDAIESAQATNASVEP